MSASDYNRGKRLKRLHKLLSGPLATKALHQLKYHVSRGGGGAGGREAVCACVWGGGVGWGGGAGAGAAVRVCVRVVVGTYGCACLCACMCVCPDSSQERDLCRQGPPHTLTLALAAACTASSTLQSCTHPARPSLP